MNARRDFWSGLFVIAAAALLLAVYLHSSLVHFTRNTRNFTVEADDLSGVAEGTEVVMGGYRLGAVDSVKVITEPSLHFELEIAVRRDVPVPKGTKVVIATKSLGGARYLVLTPPAKAAGELPEGSRLRAEPQADFQQVLTTAQAALADFAGVASDLHSFTSGDASREGLAKVIKRLDKTLADGDAMILRVNSAVASLTPGLDRGMARLEGTLANSEQAAGKLDALLASEGPELDKVLKLAQRRLEEMQALSELLKHYDPGHNPEIRDLLKHLDGSSKNLEALLAELRRRPWLLIRKGQELPVVDVPASVPAPAPAPKP